MESRIFTEGEKDKLVEAVKKREILYRKTHKNHYDHAITKNVWEKVASEVGRSVYDCKWKWKIIKDSYERKLKKIDESEIDHGRYSNDDLFFLYVKPDHAKKRKNSAKRKNDVGFIRPACNVINKTIMFDHSYMAPLRYQKEEYRFNFDRPYIAPLSYQEIEDRINFDHCYISPLSYHETEDRETQDVESSNQYLACLDKAMNQLAEEGKSISDFLQKFADQLEDRTTGKHPTKAFFAAMGQWAATFPDEAQTDVKKEVFDVLFRHAKNAF